MHTQRRQSGEMHLRILAMYIITITVDNLLKVNNGHFSHNPTQWWTSVDNRFDADSDKCMLLTDTAVEAGLTTLCSLRSFPDTLTPLAYHSFPSRSRLC